jgi:hypothetical protein
MEVHLKNLHLNKEMEVHKKNLHLYRDLEVHKKNLHLYRQEEKIKIPHFFHPLIKKNMIDINFIITSKTKTFHQKIGFNKGLIKIKIEELELRISNNIFL